MSALRQVILCVTICASLRVSVCSRDEKFNHLGSRTPYRFLQNNNVAPINYPDCEAKKIWMFGRHGTRLPGTANIIDMQTILYSLRERIVCKYNAIKSSLKADVISSFINWKNELNHHEAEDLTEEGEEELLLLGKRMQSRFPSAVPKHYDNNTYEFRSTPTQRTEASVRHFAAGLLGEEEASKVWYTPTYEWDPVLRFYKVCDKYQKEVKQNPEAVLEQKLYGESEKMFAALKKVSDFLGLDEVLTLAEAALVHQACGFETAWKKDGYSPWCDIFDTDFAKVLEYYDDLDYYWIDGYGYPITYLPACVTVRDLFEHLSDDSKHSASFLFAHSGSMLKLLAHFGISKPSQPLTHSNQDESRPWRSSPIDAFASNLAFVLYKCKDEDRVLTLFQEKIIRLPSCEEDLCPMKVLTNQYHDSIDHCHFEEICSL